MISTNQEIDVSKDDQKSINTFSRHHALSKELNENLRNLSNQYTDLQDAETELELGEDDELTMLAIGDCFFIVDFTTAKEFVEEKVDELKEKVKKEEVVLADTNKKLQKLKSSLYAKFGNSINLEED